MLHGPSPIVAVRQKPMIAKVNTTPSLVCLKISVTGGDVMTASTPKTTGEWDDLSVRLLEKKYP